MCTTYFYFQNCAFGKYRHNGGLVHLRVIVHQPQWRHYLVRNIQLVLWVVLHFMLVLVMVKVVWDLGTPTLPTRKLIVGLVVAIFFYLRVGNIHPWFIHTKNVPILHHILWGIIILLMMVMVEVLLVLGKPTSTPKNIILAETGMMRIFKNLSVITHLPPCSVCV